MLFLNKNQETDSQLTNLQDFFREKEMPVSQKLGFAPEEKLVSRANKWAHARRSARIRKGSDGDSHSGQLEMLANASTASP